MSTYKLYKSAASESDESDEAKRQAIMQVLTTVGGGGLGYLMARYGLGLKGAGAGIAGAGIGAVAGAGAGAVINNMSTDQQKKDAGYLETVDRSKVNSNIDVKQKGLDALNPLLYGKSEEAGGVSELTSAVGAAAPLSYLTAKLLKPVDAGTREALTNAKVENTLSKATAVSKKIKVDAAGVPHWVKGGEAFARKAVKGGLGSKNVNAMLEGVGATKLPGMTTEAATLAGKKYDLVNGIFRGAGDVKVSGSKILGNKLLKASVPTAIIAALARGGASVFDAWSKKKGSEMFVNPNTGEEY